MTQSKKAVIEAVKKELEATFDLLDVLRTKVIGAKSEQEKAQYMESYRQLQEKKAELQEVFKGYLMAN